VLSEILDFAPPAYISADTLAYTQRGNKDKYTSILLFTNDWLVHYKQLDLL